MRSGSILFESYIFADDEVGRELTTALAERARAGVHVYVIYDWLGSLGAGALWKPLDRRRCAVSGASIRRASTARWGGSRATIARRSRSTAASRSSADSARATAGTAIRRRAWSRGATPVSRFTGRPWPKSSARSAQVWHACGGKALPHHVFAAVPTTEAHGRHEAARHCRRAERNGHVPPRPRDRVVRAPAPVAHRRVLRRDGRVRPGARGGRARWRRRAPARAGGERHSGAVAVVPRSAIAHCSQAGVRVFEWNGTMLHAKTAVADGFWARVGSTNLNIASWMGNYELDVAIEDAAFAARMAADSTRPTSRARPRSC